MSAIEMTSDGKADVAIGTPLSPTRQFEIQFDIRRTIIVLLCIVLTLVVTGTVASIITFQVAPSPEHKLAKLMHRFDLGFEPSIPNWYSSCAILASGGLLAVIAIAKRRTKDRFAKHWFVLAALFLCMSIDEGVRFHEMIHTVIVARIECSGIFNFPWVIPATIFVAIVGLAYAPFLRHLDRRTAILFVAAGATYVTGAVGMDMVGGVIVERFGVESIQHTFSQTVEELLEMLGIVVFLYALMDHIRRAIGPVNVRLVSRGES